MGDLIQDEKPGAIQNPVYKYDLDNRGQPFDLTNVKIKQYRFVECDSVLKTNTIKVYAYDSEDLSSMPPYTAVSYVWGGKTVEDTQGTFRVRGKVDDENELSGGPINIQIIKDACRAARERDTKFLWLDRLCMSKRNKDDDDWQMRRMYNVYKSSKFCIVFPGGLEGLTRLDEETTWVNRGWTLQEAVAPAKVEVMFEWTLGSLEAKPYLYEKKKHAGQITQITMDRCAMAPLRLLLDSTISGTLELTRDDLPQKHKVTMFGTRPDTDIKADFRLVLPNVAALAVVLRESTRDTDQYYHAIWKSTMMRSTKFAYDMIFSIMGLFGVDLDPANYKDPHDCVKPAIDLVRKILATKGTRATWLGASFFSPPCPHLSTFPSFPKIFPRGSDNRPTVAIPTEGRIRAPLLMLNEYPNFGYRDSMPSGTMDEEGYLTFTAKSTPVSKYLGNNALSSQGLVYQLQSINREGTTWLSSAESPGDAEAFAVLLGCFIAYSPFKTLKPDASSVRGFIVVRQPDDREKFYLDSYFMLNVSAANWILSWEKHEFKVGGRHQIGATVLYEENLPDCELEDYILKTLRPPQQKSPPVGPIQAESLDGVQFEVEVPEVRALDVEALDVKAIEVEAVEAVEAEPVKAVEVEAVAAEVVADEVEAAQAEPLEIEPQTYYQLVSGDPWQEEGRWTSEAMEKLWGGLMKSD